MGLETPVPIRAQKRIRLALHTQLTKDGHGRAPIGERRLKKIQSDERCEPQPIMRMIMGKGQTQEYEKAGHATQDSLDSHNRIPPFIKDTYERWIA